MRAFNRFLALALMSSGMVAAADASAQVTYSFAADNAFVGNQTFVLTVPDFVKTSTTFGSSSFTTSNITSAQFCFPGASCGGIFTASSEALAVTTGSATGFYYFSGTPFLMDGVSVSTGNVGTLTVTGSPTPVVAPVAGAAPEPATWGMMILGFGIVGATLRRRRHITTRVTYAV